MSTFSQIPIKVLVQILEDKETDSKRKKKDIAYRFGDREFEREKDPYHWTD